MQTNHLRTHGEAYFEFIATPGVDPTNNIAERPADPGPLPEDLLHVPGFIAQVMDYCLSTARRTRTRHHPR